MKPKKSIYNAEISAGSLLPRESREIARLLLDQVDEDTWHKALVVENVLQKKSPASSRRMARLIRNRLEMMDRDHWELVLEPEREVALQALLAAAIRHSRLLEDFLVTVVKENFRTFKKQLTSSDWRTFLSECESRDPAVSSWSESTRKKLRQVIIRILHEAGYLEDTREMTLSPIRIHPKVEEYLLGHKMEDLLRCMEINR